MLRSLDTCIILDQSMFYPTEEGQKFSTKSGHTILSFVLIFQVEIYLKQYHSILA